MMFRLIFVSVVFAHVRLKTPIPRSTNSGIKEGPCGNDPRKQPQEINPGWMTIEFEEPLVHPGDSFRIALSNEGVDEGFEDCILLNHIPSNTTQYAFGETVGYRINVFIPDVQCEHCVLQIYSPMTDKIEKNSFCEWNHERMANPEFYDVPYWSDKDWGRCDSELHENLCCSNYHSCADVKISGKTNRDEFQCKQPENWPFQVGKPLPCMYTNCTASQTKRDFYTQTFIEWENGWIKDDIVPEIYRKPLKNVTNSSWKFNLFVVVIFHLYIIYL